MRILVYGACGECYGGIESFLLTMNEYMSDECVFDYVIIGDGCMYADRIHARGGKIYYIASYKQHPLRSFLETWRVAKAARTTHDIAYFNLFSMCHSAALLMSKCLRYHIVLHAHNNNIPNKSRLYHLLHRFLRWALQGLHCTRLTNSYQSSAFMFGPAFSNKNTVELVYNAIEVSRYQFSVEKRLEKRQILQLQNEWTIGFAGRLATQKNTFFLLEIFAEIHKLDGNAVLLLAGEGELKALLHEKAHALGIQQAVRFLGAEKDMPAFYCAVDAFLLPSLFEGLGIVLVEAQAAGLRCFTSAEVVPSIARLSEESLQFISLQKSAKEWAEDIFASRNINWDRTSLNMVALQSNFNILREAARLEDLLKRRN